jgi:hypothetical protein
MEGFGLSGLLGFFLMEKDLHPTLLKTRSLATSSNSLSAVTYIR